MKIKLFLVCLINLILMSCNTYKTFYKKTATVNNISNYNQQRLDFSEVSNDSIYKQLPLFSNLYSLNLSNNPTLNIDKALSLIQSPLKLKVLVLNNNELSEVPKLISNFENLKQLSLNQNPELNLKNTFENIQKLSIEFLSLQQNKLTDLPLNTYKLDSLKDLNLSDNNFFKDAAFEKIKQLPSLQSLWLTNNKLEVFPKGLCSLDQLKNLYIEHNSLKSIPAEINLMKKVWTIHAGYNLFNDLPVAFAEIPKLLLLHINNCNIKSIPRIYETKKSNVKGIILDANRLSEATIAFWKKKSSRFFLLSMEHQKI